MSDLEYKPAYWRAKAEEARAVADTLGSEQARKHVMSCAASYDRLAELAERMPPRLHVRAANTR